MIAGFNAFLSGFALYPQVLKSFSSGESEDLSSLTYWLILINSIIWVFYALHRKTLPLLVSSALNTVAAFIILFLIGFGVKN